MYFTDYKSSLYHVHRSGPLAALYNFNHCKNKSTGGKTDGFSASVALCVMSRQYLCYLFERSGRFVSYSMTMSFPLVNFYKNKNKFIISYTYTEC